MSTPPPPTRDAFDVDQRRDWNDAGSWQQHQHHMSQHHAISSSMDSARLSPNSELKRRRKLPPILTDAEKHQVATEMQESKLGVLCNVCGKMLKNKDALNFHIMNTKLPGHEAALQQLVKSNDAAESMRVAARLSEATRLEGAFSDEPQTPIVHNVPSPMTPGFGSSCDVQIDPKTGIFVKQEPLEPTPEEDDFLSETGGGEFSAALTKVEVNLKSGGGPIKQEPQHGSSAHSDGSLMPPPSGPPPHRKKGSKSSKNKLFKCCECDRAFKRVQKLVKHVERKHSGKPKKAKQQQQPPQKQVPQTPPPQQVNHQSKPPQRPDQSNSIKIKSENPADLLNRDGDDDNHGSKLSLKLTPMGCPDCSVIFSAKDEMMRHFAMAPHNLNEGISANRCPGLNSLNLKDNFVANP